MSVVPEPRSTVVPHPVTSRGTLRTSAGEELSVQTYPGAEEVLLVVLTQTDEISTARADDSATLEYATVRGVIRMHGEAVFTDPSHVRFHADRDPEVLQRREFVRASSSNQISLHPPRIRDGAPPVHTIDVSGGGMLLFGATHLTLGELVGFEMAVGDGEASIVGVARVVRVDRDGRRGLEFAHIEEADRQRLIRLVFACMRASRAKTRGDLI